MKVLLLGKHGQVGRELLRTLPRLGSLTALDLPDVDFSRPDTLAGVVRGMRPDVVVNAAAYTAVDRAETEPELARLINAAAVAALAAAAAELDAVFVHYSTDYVFDGQKAGCYTETDEPAPVSIYGASKLAGDRAVAAAGGRHLVLRTSWVYATHGDNFVRRILQLGGDRDTLEVVDDQTGAPTSAVWLADVTAAAILRCLNPLGPALPWGLYHVAPRGETSWHGLARFVLGAARDRGLPLRLQPEAVTPIPSTAYPAAARRPANSRLCTAKLSTTLNIDPPAWQDGVVAVVAALVSDMQGAPSS